MGGEYVTVYAKKCGVSLDEVAELEKNRLIPELRQLLSAMDEKQQRKVAEMIKLMMN